MLWEKILKASEKMGDIFNKEGTISGRLNEWFIWTHTHDFIYSLKKYRTLVKNDERMCGSIN